MHLYRSVVSGATMFDILPPHLKSLAVRSHVKYAPHPYVWMAPARSRSTGLGLETEGLELKFDDLPAWEESKTKAYPMVCGLLALALSYTHMVFNVCICRFGKILSRAVYISKFIQVVPLRFWSSHSLRVPLVHPRRSILMGRRLQTSRN